MQGRLTPRGKNPIQFFPFVNWQKEFEDASFIGLDEIEFIFDFDRYTDNPLWNDDGVKEIKRLIKEYKISVRTICADYFMACPFVRVSDFVKLENTKILKILISRACEIGAKIVEIPLLDNSSLRTKEEEDVIINILAEIIPLAKKVGIEINLETDFNPGRYKSFLERCGNNLPGITYDSGNSSGLGYDHKEEILTYGKHITNVHIKDRKKGGKTVELGSGDANFKEVFKALKEIHYRGSIVLQVARGPDNEELQTILGQKQFVVNYINNYLI